MSGKTITLRTPYDTVCACAVGIGRKNQGGIEAKQVTAARGKMRTHIRYCHGGPFQLEGGDTVPTSPYPEGGPSPFFFTCPGPPALFATATLAR